MTRPIRASASQKAKPRIWLARMRPAASGWRARAWVPLPKMMPTPTPEPRAFRSPVTAARVWDMPVFLLFQGPVGVGHRTNKGRSARCSVVLGERALDEGASQEYEDVRLQRLDEELERGHHDDHHEREAGVSDSDAFE